MTGAGGGVVVESRFSRKTLGLPGTSCTLLGPVSERPRRLPHHCWLHGLLIVVLASEGCVRNSVILSTAQFGHFRWPRV